MSNGGDRRDNEHDYNYEPSREVGNTYQPATSEQSGGASDMPEPDDSDDSED